MSVGMSTRKSLDRTKVSDRCHMLTLVRILLSVHHVLPHVALASLFESFE
jgi:hypothetical protein